MQKSVVFQDSGRVFIDPAVGCASNCRFCYIGEFGYSTVEISPYSGADIATILSNDNRFIPGQNGTIISFSPHTEAFDKQVISKTIEYIKALSALGNPMQIATRRKLSREVVATAVSGLAYYGQLTLFVSTCSISYHHLFEAGTTQPSVRFETIEICHQENLPVCLYIKPIIPNVTILDAENYISVIENYSVKFVCVGALYTNPKLQNKLDLTILDNNLKNSGMSPGKHSIPFSESLKQAGTMASVYEMEEKLKVTNATIHRTSSCVMADILNVASARSVWTRLPHLCINCQDCASLALQYPVPMPFKEV